MPSAVYMISCADNEGLYIGSSICFETRRKKHLYALKNSFHKCKKLQALHDEFGANALIFKVVEIVDDLLFLRAREQFWIWRFAEKIINTCSTVDGTRTNIPHSAEIKAKISAGLKKAFIEGRHKPTNKEMATRNITAYNLKIKTGIVKSACAKPERNAKLIEFHRINGSLRDTAKEFGITTSSALEIIRKYAPQNINLNGRWRKKC